MQDDIAEQKKMIRKQCRQTRQNLSEPFRTFASQQICNKIENLQAFQKASVVLTYMPIKAEVDLRPLLDGFPHITWVLPRILPEPEHSLVFHIYDPNLLVYHPFGMAEPSRHLSLIAPGEIHLALVPGLAYDRQGWRLGYGGGYYDRFLQDFAGISLGVVYEALFLDNLPRGHYDIPVNGVVTELSFYATSAQSSASGPS